jgi:PAS domain S-box-containing protein
MSTTKSNDFPIGHFESLINNIPGIFYRCKYDRQWTMLFISEEIFNVSGYKANELINNRIISYGSIIFPKDASKVFEEIDKAINENKYWDIEYRLCEKNGGIHWVHEKGKAVINENKEILFLDGFILDITDKKEAEEDLRKSEEHHRMLAKSIPDLLFIINSNGEFIDYKADINDLFSQPAFFLGKRYHDVMPTDVAAQFDAAINKARSANEPVELSYSLTITGQHNHYQARVMAYSSEKFIVFVRNISDQKKAENELLSQSKLQNILLKIASDYINLPINEIESATAKSLAELGQFVNADRTYIFEYDWENQICNNTHEWCEEGIVPQIDELQNIPLDMLPRWVDTHKKGETMYIPDVFALPKEDGVRQILEPQDVKSLITIPMMEHGQCTGFIGFDSVRKHHIYSDKEKILLSLFSEMLVNAKHRIILEMRLIQERKKADAANWAKSEFLANMSHEIRTPMNSILGFSEVLYNTSADETHKSYLKTILSSGKTLLSLINDILDLSKIEAGRMEISPELADIRLIIMEIEHLFKQRIQDKQLEFIIEVEEKFPQAIVIDEVRLRQILLNICGNAIKFTEKGFIKVQVTVLNDHNGIIDFEIAVVDTGIGIPEEDQQRIFESFNQRTGIDSKRFGGTGLGLSISKRLCELMNGEIIVESKVNKGSRFSIVFKNIKYSDEVADHDSGYFWDENIITFKGSKILIVDDVPHNRNLVVTFLKDYKLQIYEAENGEMAIEYARIYQPDLIFMDIRMPGINGYEASDIIKQQSANRSVPIIALTASTMQSEYNMLMKAFDGYLRKPVQKRTVVSELIKHLPHSINEMEKNQPDPDTAVTEIPDNVKEEFMTAFEKPIAEQANFVVIDDLNELINKMNGFALRHQLNEFRKQVDELKRISESFEFEDIQKCLKAIQLQFKSKE